LVVGLLSPWSIREGAHATPIWDCCRLVAVVSLLVLVGALGVPSSVGASESLTPSACDANYHPCIPPYPPDLDCAQIGHKVWVIGPSDPHGLDANHDGTGCESYPDISGPPAPAPAPTPPAPAGPIPARCATVDKTEPAVTSSPSLSATRFVPLGSPTRVFDTRTEGDAGYVCPGQTITKTIGGAAGVPSNARPSC
jgi:hypothetical protein